MILVNTDHSEPENKVNLVDLWSVSLADLESSEGSHFDSDMILNTGMDQQEGRAALAQEQGHKSPLC